MDLNELKLETNAILNTIKERLFNISKEKEVIVVCDWDEVIQNFELHLIRNCSQLFDFPPEVSSAISQGYHPSSSQLDLGYVRLTQTKEIKEIFFGSEVYRQIPFTSIPQFLIDLVEEKIVSKVVMLTHIPRKYVSDPRKKEMFDFLFGGRPEFHILMARWIKERSQPSKKGHVIAEIIPDFSLFIDDNPTFIQGVSNFFPQGDKIYLSPLGVHQNREKLRAFFETQGNSENYYEVRLWDEEPCFLKQTGLA